MCTEGQIWQIHRIWLATIRLLLFSVEMSYYIPSVSEGMNDVQSLILLFSLLLSYNVENGELFGERCEMMLRKCANFAPKYVHPAMPLIAESSPTPTLEKRHCKLSQNGRGEKHTWWREHQVPLCIEHTRPQRTPR